MKVPIGVKDKDGKEKTRLTLEPDTDSDVSDKMRMMLERFSEGDLKQSELADYAESINLTTLKGERFSPQSMNNILRNITYAGFVCNSMTDNEPVKAKHTGLISLETYLRNQAVLDGRKPDEAMPRFTATCPLKHSLLCTSCRKPLTGSEPTGGSGKSSPRYHCTRCTGMGSKGLDRANELVNGDIKDVRNDMTKIDADMQKALQSMLDGDISKQEKEEYQSSLRIKRLDLEEELDKLRDVQSLNDATITYVCNFMNAPARMWQDADAETKVVFQQMITENGIAFDLKKEKFGTDGLSMLYRLKDTQKDAEASLDSNMVTSRRIELRLPG